jgi:outer membrane protein assembly factor BamB
MWSSNVGLGYSNVCLIEGRLITHGFDVKTEEDVVVCLDAMTGKQHWSYAFSAVIDDTMHGGGSLTTAVARGDRVFVLSRMGAIHCLNLNDGSVHWKRDLETELKIERGSFGFTSSPLLVDDGLILNVGPTLKLDPANGKSLWTTRDYGYSYGTPVLGEIDGQSRLLVFNGSGLVMLDPDSGSERGVFEWTSQYNVNAATPIVVDGSRAFICTGYNDKGCAMIDLVASPPAIAWKSMAMSSKMNGCVLFDGHLYGFDDSILRCLDLQGKVLWQERGLGVGTVIASADGRLIVLSEEGELVIARATADAFEVQSRKQVLEEGKCWTTPVLSGGLIFCRNSVGELVCLDHRVEK